MTWHTEPDPALEDLLEYIRNTRGVNFTGYKRSTLTRRIRKRMEQVHIASYGDYTDFLEAEADEFSQLFDTILINVTAFFRDKPSWDYLASDVIPKIVSNKAPGDPIRVWSAGCASGQEAYSVAMMLAEAIGGSQIRHRLKIYATDIDGNALEQARQGVYTVKETVDVPEELLKRYFEPVGDKFAVRNGPRRAVIFGRHDLTRDPPIGRLDLLVCRNTLMYFNSDVQARILNLFHFAVEQQGYLFLGKAEMLLLHGRLFTAVSMKHRIFERTDVSVHREIPSIEPTPGISPHEHDIPGLLMDNVPIAVMGVDEEGTLVEFNARAAAMFALTPKDMGQPLQNLEISYRPLELRSRIDRAYKERRAVEERGVEHVLDEGDSHRLDITVAPLIRGDNSVAGASITFADVTEAHKVHEDLQRARQDLETTYEELRSTNEELETTNEELQSSNEELETTNEELQSTNEELETTNEELQSTNEELETMNEELSSSNEELETTNEELQSSNEELETMNEELQSTNEELETTNEELRTRATEIADLNDRFGSLVSSLSSAVIVVDRELLVELWNRNAEEWWGLGEEEVIGRPFATLDIGLPVASVIGLVRRCLYEGVDRDVAEVDGFNRTGMPVRMRVMCTPVVGGDPVSGVVLVIDLLDP